MPRAVQRGEPGCEQMGVGEVAGGGGAQSSLAVDWR